MQSIQIQIEDWQQAALNQMARARGIDVESMAQRLLSERLHERADAWLDRLLASPCGYMPTIEHRLQQLFDE